MMSLGLLLLRTAREVHHCLAIAAAALVSHERASPWKESLQVAQPLRGQGEGKGAGR